MHAEVLRADDPVPPLRAPQLAGTRQALDRTQRVAVDLGGRITAVSVPTCWARSWSRHLPRLAIAFGVRNVTSRIWRACTRLVADPAALSPTAKDRRRMRDSAEPTWEVLDDPSERAAARAARRLLTTRP